MPSWCKEQTYCFIRQRYKGHWQGRRRSSPESGNLYVSEGSTPKPSGSRRINSRTIGPQDDISVITGFQEYTSKITKGKDLRPAKSTRNCRTTRPTKVLLPRSCPIDLEGTPNGSTEGNMCYLNHSPRLIDIGSGPSPEDRVRCCIKSIKTLGSRLQNKYTSPGAISIDIPISEQ